MRPESETDRRLNRIIWFSLSLSFALIIASLETLRPARSGFDFAVTWRTFAALLVGMAIVVPCFRIIVYSDRKPRRRFALLVVGLIGAGGFFYPLRFVPREKMVDVFTGLGIALLALAIVGGLLLLVRRFFEAKS